MTLLATGKYLTQRTVWTYLPDRWPAGLISGYGDDEGHFHVEHVVTFRRGILLAMLRAGVEVAHDEGFTALVITIPVDFPPALGLLRLSRRLGFEHYATDPVAYHVVRWL